MASWYDYVPGVANVAGVVKGDTKEALGGAGTTLVRKAGGIKGITNDLGITANAPADPSQGPDAQASRDFATQLRAQYRNLAPGTAPVVAPTMLDATQSDQARGIATQNIRGLQAVADGAPTAADALLTQGTDAAARGAMGLAATYSRNNPGAALRQGLAAGDDAYARAASVAAQQKANEQAAARGEIGTFADAVRSADLGAAGANAAAANTAAKTNADNSLTQKQLDNQFQLGLGGLAATTTATPLAAAVANQKVQQDQNKANQEGTGAMYSTFGKLLSDERAKTDVKTVPLADAYARDIHGVQFAYKPGVSDGGKHVGVLAQDVEKALPDAVKDTPSGFKAVDVGHMTMANAGATAEIARRLRALEARA